MNKYRILLPILLLLSIISAEYSSAEGKSLGTQLFEAVLSQELPEIQSLISKGAGPNHIENGRPVLGWAAQNGNVEVVKLLLQAGANPNVADTGVGHTPLMRAIDTQQEEIVQLLLQSKALPNAKSKSGESCLMMAVQSRKPKLVQLLIDAGADVKEVTAEGNSPVLTAAQDASAESLEIIKLLGAAKANLDASNAAYTPLIYAIQQSNKDLVKALLEAGANPNGRSATGHLPLQSALDNPEILKLLLAAKADYRAKLTSNDTILGEAIYNQQVDSAKLLIEAGAGGVPEFESAKQGGLTEIVALLEQKVGNGKNPVIAVTGIDTAPSDAFNQDSSACTVVDAARKQMNLHGRLQKQVDAGKRSSEIFRTFNEDAKDLVTLLSGNPPEACRLLDRLAIKYGISWKD